MWVQDLNTNEREKPNRKVHKILRCAFRCFFEGEGLGWFFFGKGIVPHDQPSSYIPWPKLNFPSKKERDKVIYSHTSKLQCANFILWIL